MIMIIIGDSIDVANFDQSVANNAILRIYQLIEFSKEVVGMKDAEEADKDGGDWDALVFEQQQVCRLLFFVF